METNGALRIDELLAERAWVIALARSLVRDEALALDLAQDTMVTALERPPASRASLKGWLATVLRNRFRDRLRVRSRRDRREAAAARPEELESAGELAARADEHRRVLQAVVGLEEPYREVVLLRYYEGLSPMEIGARQDVPASTVRTRLLRAHERLRGVLDDEHGGDGRAWAVALLPLISSPPRGAVPAAGAAAKGMGAFLMVHKLKIVAAVVVPVVLLALLISVNTPNDPTPPAAGGRVAGNEGAERAPGVTETAAVDLPAPDLPSAPPAPSNRPRTRRSKVAALPVADGFRVGIDRNGQVTLGDRRFGLLKFDGIPLGTQGQGLLDLTEALFEVAEQKREMGHPAQPSLMAPLIDAGADVPWWIVRDVMAAAADPSVRMYRLHWLAIRAETEEEVGLPVFLPMDRGLATTKIALLRPPEVRVTLRGAPGGTTVTLLDQDLGTGETGLALLGERLPALFEANPDRSAIVAASDDVPFGQVVRVMDLLPDSSGWKNLDLGDSPLRHVLETDADAEGLLRAAIEERGLEFDGTVLDAAEGLSEAFRAFLTARLAWHERNELLESLVVPDREHLALVKRALARPELSYRSAFELPEKARMDRSLLLGLAAVWIESGRSEDFLRALTVAALVAKAEPAARFKGSWWYCQVLILEGCLGFADAARDRSGVDRALGLLADHERLGILERSPYRNRLLELQGRAKALLTSFE